jgi:ribosome maturation factor RimP
MDLIEKVEAALAEKFATDEEFSDCFAVEIKLQKGNLLEVFVDADGAMDFRRCQRLSRFLEAKIDENNWLGDSYTLEVSSPGIGRPLKFLRQYVKNIGRTVEITLNSGEIEEGILLAADENEVVLEQKKRIEEGKKKKNVVVQTSFSFQNIKKTEVLIRF